METPKLTNEERAEFIYLQRKNLDSTLAELGEILGLTRERVRQIDKDYRKRHGLPFANNGSLRECEVCKNSFWAHSRRQRYCGSIVRQNGCSWDMYQAYLQSDEYKEKQKQIRLKYYKPKAPKLYTKICENRICAKEFTTERPNQRFCGSYAKQEGCSWYNQRWHRKVNPKQRYCKRCKNPIPIVIGDENNKRIGASKRYCGWADRTHKVGAGEGCTVIVYLWGLHKNGAISERVLYRHLMNIKDPKLTVWQPEKSQLENQPRNNSSLSGAPVASTM